MLTTSVNQYLDGRASIVFFGNFRKMNPLYYKVIVFPSLQADLHKQQLKYRHTHTYRQTFKHTATFLKTSLFTSAVNTIDHWRPKLHTFSIRRAILFESF